MPENKLQDGIRLRREYTRHDVLTHEAQIQNDIAKSSNAQPSSEIVTVLKNHLKKLQRLREKLSEYDNNWINAATDELKKNEYSTEYGIIQSFQDKLDNLQTNLESRIENICQGKKSSGNLEELLTQVLQQQINVKSEMDMTTIVSDEGGGPSSTPPHNNGVAALLEKLVAVQEQQTQALPAIKVRRFNGDVTQFIAFWEEFAAVVHDRPHLKDIQRFKYLRDHLDGEAARALQGIPPTEDNYPKAVRYLIKRYGDLETIVMGIFTNMMNLPKVQKVADLNRLKELLDKVNSGVMALETMNLDAKYYAGVLYPVLLGALPDALVYRFLSRIVSAGKL